MIPFQIEWLIEASAGFYAYLPDQPLARYLLQFAITLLVVGAPCVLMGGTLPLLIRELTARDGALDQATGWLYAINTFGAATGCYLAGFVLLPTMGLGWTNTLAAATNVGIGLAALMVSRRTPVPRARRAAAVVTDVSPVASQATMRLYAAAALSGLGALALEMTWSRQLALVLGGSTYAYSATLFIVLTGIAAGSLIFHLGLRRVALSAWLPAALIGTLVLACSFGSFLLPWLSVQLGQHRDLRQSLFGNTLICLTASAVVELVPAVLMGILFPLFVDMTQERASRVGRAVGNVYAWNTFGSIAGASLTAIVLFPLIGTAGSLALAMSFYLLTMLLVMPLRSKQGLLLGGAVTLAGAAMVAVTLAQGIRC